ncbi:hypothetical protein [Stieleria sp. JC731]|nr:hypothetical protein [Stieleria sp. JC731]
MTDRQCFGLDDAPKVRSAIVPFDEVSTAANAVDFIIVSEALRSD